MGLIDPAVSVETVRKTLQDRLESPVEVGSYRGVEGTWAKVELDPRIDNDMRPTSLSLTGTTVDEMKVRFVATTGDRETAVAALSRLESRTPATGVVSAENHDLSESDEFWPHIFYENLTLSEAVRCLEVLEGEALPGY